MCGRYTIKNPASVAAAYAASARLLVSQGARFNAAPSQFLPVVFGDGSRATAALMSWGLIPAWDRTAKPGLAPTNARSETALQKPMFREALQRRRCLVPADGFYEWRRVDAKTKVPHLIQLIGGRPFAMAGIYEKATELHPATFALLTTRANDLMRPIHDRMPVILSSADEPRWLSDDGLDANTLDTLATPFTSAEMETFTVSALVNNTRHDSPECAKHVPYEEQPCFLW